MSDLTGKFDILGFDLAGLDNLIYLGGGPEEPPTCVDHCISCAVSCSTCGVGCSNGPSK
jgi:hypothetical protein